ncbi:MAG TPA: DUF6443 domain-containing protein [Chitinophagaceae bacterium]
MGGKLTLLKLPILGSFVLLQTILCAQQIAPAPYSSGTKVNYIRTWDAGSPQVHPDTLMAKTVKDVKQTTQYLDGLGRPLQTVMKQGSLMSGSSIAYDLVSPVLYDEFGREAYKYLPFAANSTGGNSSISDGLFKLNPFQQDSIFNKGMFGDESYYYSKTVFEASPLNRTLEGYAPGNNWVGTASQSSEANRRGVKMKYWFNTATDSIRIWTVTNVSNSFGTYATSSTYAAGSLFKTVSQDEHNKQVIEFKDKEGKVLLKKVQLTADADTGTGKGYYGWLCTYYLYDSLNNLRCVVQPKGLELLAANSWSMSYSSGVIMNEQCFRYEYDSRNRMILKKVPGVGTVYMIYDARDRLVMMQDSVLRVAHKWQYTLYDALNRDTTTGLITDDTYYNDAAYHRGQAQNSITYPTPGSYADEVLTKKFYDSYDWHGWEANPLSATRNTSYDSYLLSASNTVWPYPQNATVQSNQLRGIVTGTKTKVLGTASTYLYSVIFYDDKGRVIQTQSTNITTGTDISTMQYSWSGQTLLTINKNEKAVTNPQTSIMLSKITYDDLGRPLKTEKKISTTNVSSGAMPGSWKTVSQHEYNALGQLKKKKLGAAPLDSLTYEYNIRGWMLGMNRSYVKDTTSTANWFGFDLGYDKTSFTVNSGSQSYTAAQYNGNINGMLWRSTGDDMLRKYDFTYDATNRFLSADFNQLNSNSFSKAAGIDFSVTGMSYDANGNILNMNQKGWKLGGSVTIDSLLYTYISNSNKLLNVIDRNNDTTTKLCDFRSSHTYMTALSNNKTTTATDYSYDANGNMYVDNNKDISDIHYNYLNLPDSITVINKGNIKYVYDATGNKLKKITTEGGNTTTTLYLFGNFVNDTLQFIGTEDGRVRLKQADSSLQYDYFIKDHLGNVRMVLTEETQTDAYPVASLETTPLSSERLYYSKVDSGRVNKSMVSGYPTNTYTNPNDYIQKLSGNEVKVGTGTVLKVMAGDKVNIRVNSWWKSNDTPDTPVSPLNDLLSALSGNIGSLGGSHPTSTEITSSGVLSGNATSFLNSQNGYTTSKPKAFLNWILFDERFAYASSSSGFEQVGASNTFTTHAPSELAISKSGYLYVYVSNETPNINVFFDNLQVTHVRGPLLEETHYYPFGLMQAGISSKALGFGKPENKRKFTSQELDEDFGLSWYQHRFRNHDPQIGRFVQIDPLAPKYMHNSTYAYAENRPIDGIDLEGLEYLRAGEVLIQMRISYSDNQVSSASVRLTRTNVSKATEVFVFNKQSKLRDASAPDPYLLGTINYKPASTKTTNEATSDDAGGSEVGVLGQRQVDHPAVPKNKREARAADKDPLTTVLSTSSGAVKGDAIIAMVGAAGLLLDYMHDKEISIDINKANQQASTAGISTVKDINMALSLNLIPSNYLNNSDLTSFANYLLFGEKPSDYNRSNPELRKMLKDFEKIKVKVEKNKTNPPCTVCVSN